METISKLYCELLNRGTLVEEHGGYYFGMMRGADGNVYALFLPPRNQNCRTTLPFAGKNIDCPRNNTLFDGWVNTYKSSSGWFGLGNKKMPWIEWVKSLKSFGLGDLYVPSIFEMELMYRNLKPRDKWNRTSNLIASSVASGFLNPPENIPAIENGVNPYSLPTGKSYTPMYPQQVDEIMLIDGSDDAINNTGANLFTSTWLCNLGAYAFDVDFGVMSSGYQTVPHTMIAIRRVLVE